jgi:hypothetical protein
LRDQQGREGVAKHWVSVGLVIDPPPSLIQGPGRRTPPKPSIPSQRDSRFRGYQPLLGYPFEHHQFARAPRCV